MKPYPLGIDNPIIVKGVIGSHKWALYWREDMQRLQLSPINCTMEARRAIIRSL